MAFTDDLNDTDAVLLQNHTPSGGTAWSNVHAGTVGWKAEIYSNALTFRSDSGSGSGAWSCDDQGSADHYSQGKLITVAAKAQVFCAVRLVDEDNFAGWRVAGTGASGLRLSKCIGGTITDLTSGTSPSMQGVANDSYKAEAEGTTYRLYYDSGGGWTQSGSDQTISNVELSTSETTQGVRANDFTGNSPFIDDFEAGPLAAGASISPTSGTLTLSTVAPTLTQTTNADITSAQGNLSLSTTAPTINVTVTGSVEITPAQGDISLSTQAPTITQTTNANISPSQGSIALSTQAPTVSITANISISVPQGNISLSTFTPTLSITAFHPISPAQGNLSISTSAPTVTGGESALWTVQTPDSTSWSVQAADSTVWTDQTEDSTTWTVQ